MLTAFILRSNNGIGFTTRRLGWLHFKVNRSVNVHIISHTGTLLSHSEFNLFAYSICIKHTIPTSIMATDFYDTPVYRTTYSSVACSYRSFPQFGEKFYVVIQL
jgi:hypothetical protein